MNERPNGKRLRILGIRGIPAAHGGFETFAEHLAAYLVARDWRVTVYCQEIGHGPAQVDLWHGVERVRIPVAADTPAASVWFDWKAVRHASRHPGDLCLTLGYNTAVFCARLRLAGVVNVMNMDGIEWRRDKWGPLTKAWFWANERAGCWLANHLIADHADIKAHLATRVRADKISTIAYGADVPVGSDPARLAAYGLVPRQYLTVIARAEPENSLLQIVQGFSSRPRGLRLAVLGQYDADNAFHAQVRKAAGPEVDFLGPIYEPSLVQALRAFSLAYVHGHRVGGTNPSLVEALAAGNPVLAHDNRFNRWVAGPGACYFANAEEFSDCLDKLLPDLATLSAMGRASRQRFEQAYTWERILGEYEQLLTRWLPQGRAVHPAEPVGRSS